MFAESLRHSQTVLESAPFLPGWAIVGASRRAQRGFLPALAALRMRPDRTFVAGDHVRAVYSRNSSRANALAAPFAIPFATDELAAALDRPDVGAVYVASRPRDHAAQVRAALLAGKHVFCEPPLALDPEEADRLVFMAANRSLVLAVNQSARAHPLINVLARLLHEETVGEVLGLHVSNTALLSRDEQTWRLAPPDGGVYLARTLDSVDVAMYLLQDRPVRIAAHPGEKMLNGANAPEAGVAEEVFTWIQPADHALRVTLHDALFVPHPYDAIEIAGAHGTLLAAGWTGPAQGATLHLLRSGRLKSCATGVTGAEFDEPFVAALACCWAAMMEPSIAPVLSGAEHLPQLEALQMIERSVRSGRAYTLGGSSPAQSH
jgi:predicted dehydrogenase